MDLNDFKEINDTYGHHVGDRALREVAQVLRTAIRPYDICVRYAGDEFIVVLAGCGLRRGRGQARGAAAGDRRRSCSRRGRATPVPLSISAGAAVFPHDGDSYESLLAKADSRMYRDKSARKREAATHGRRPWRGRCVPRRIASRLDSPSGCEAGLTRGAATAGPTCP